MKRKVIILLGPTATGKTDISIGLAKLLNTEIISADSMQIYRYMDIGTAKPSLQQRTEVSHHMIDIVNPWDYFSAGAYIEEVGDIFEKLLKKDKIPLVVGGTGLYMRAMTEGIFEGPDADWNLRSKLLEIEKGKPGKLYSILQEIDPYRAEKISPSDLRRIIRALEVCFKEKAKMSDLQKKFTKPLPYEFIKVGVIREREELYSLIEQRVDKMLENGLVEEVRNVLRLIKKHGKTNFPLPSLQAIGYKEIAGYLADIYPLKEAIRLIKKRTKNYAKRQITWFRTERDILWFDISGRYDSDRIVMDIFSKINFLLHK
ncbi:MULTISPECIES: tRNA (adenosine(37)-N6)-dimethylallyltransferase MiaA [Thermodesulfovibrio]|jgi:tRNA dimethylallyltransferase|uniref:tRNA (adenosine(37)-N6)-dimethylallyltransferase MiaA n=1 Tax=Thermodesulfovibrio TaxID=28261 RepID=UPI0026382BD7|nr:tRNA (adenosine(37)-N6)-dimethylallyltransferase MiaA [Thermodesulfovibrio sp.]